jgi:hypothetical protein
VLLGMDFPSMSGKVQKRGDVGIIQTAAVLSGAQVAAIYPLGLIPIFLGPPLGILTPIYSLRNLAVNRTSFSPAPVTAR